MRIEEAPVAHLYANEATDMRGDRMLPYEFILDASELSPDLHRTCVDDLFDFAVAHMDLKHIAASFTMHRSGEGETRSGPLSPGSLSSKLILTAYVPGRMSYLDESKPRKPYVRITRTLGSISPVFNYLDRLDDPMREIERIAEKVQVTAPSHVYLAVDHESMLFQYTDWQSENRTARPSDRRLRWTVENPPWWPKEWVGKYTFTPDHTLSLGSLSSEEAAAAVQTLFDNYFAHTRQHCPSTQ